MNKILIVLIFLISTLYCIGIEKNNSNGLFDFDGKQLRFKTNNEMILFTPKFIIFYAKNDPKIALRPAGIENVIYNVITWQGEPGKSLQMPVSKKKSSDKGDGFDESVLNGNVNDRTADLFKAGENFQSEIERIEPLKDGFLVRYKENNLGSLKATFTLKEQRPTIRFEFNPLQEGYYSIGYVGAEEHKPDEVAGIWQPLIWQEKRLPTQPFMTLAFRCPLPGTFVMYNDVSYGVFASPDEFPYAPLPTMNNSRFGVAVRNSNGNAQPMLFSPVLGGAGSRMKVGTSYSFTMNIWAGTKSIPDAYQDLAEGIFDFHDYRKNDISTLNSTLDNIIAYSLDKYAWFIDSLKGCAYSTDVPGAVKNVSSLNPLELAYATDNRKMFDERAYPIIEFLLSRQKFLFSLDPKQKIQNPSRKMLGPVAPITELTALYNITEKSNPFLLDLAREEYNSKRIRNLEVKEEGRNWKNALSLYHATGEKEYLIEAEKMADRYLIQRVDTPQDSFNDNHSQGFFFWPGFTNDWISLLELYEATQNERYLEAAHTGARYYAMFCWMSPVIPRDSIRVNKGGIAPIYWYLKSKGHEQMTAPEEVAPAWRLSEIGLTSESSGTSNGHRAIFMANYAPWMLRLGYYTNDNFLQNIAKAAIIGRYRNFPGYHINTERTTIYEKEDYPLRAHKKLSYNSFHYNHILPMASMLLDYLVTDTYVRSKGAISFPGEFIEGYAYLQNKFYGHKAGSFYGEKAWLWMPNNLLTSTSVELNYTSARVKKGLVIAFSNQSNNEQISTISLNKELLKLIDNEKHKVIIHINNCVTDKVVMHGNQITIKVPANGLTTIEIEGIATTTDLQEKITTPGNQWEHGYASSKIGDARMMIINAGQYKTKAYFYLRQDDSVFKEVTFSVKMNNGETKKYDDKHFPYELTLDIQETDKSVSCKIAGVTIDGEIVEGDWLTLSRN